MLADALGVVVGRAVAEAGERLAERVAAEPEVRLGLAPDRDDRVALAGQHVGLDLALGGALHAGVVAAAQAAVGGDHDVAGGPDLAAAGEQRRVAAGAGGGEVADDLGDLLGVRDGRVHALLSLDDPRGGDQLHRARDLLGGLHRPDAAPKNALLSTCHLDHSVASVFC